MQTIDFKSGTVVSTSAEETEKVGFDFGTYLCENNELDAFVAMYGDLGSGKTAFVRGMASKLVPNAAISSPTYTIVNTYSSGKTNLYHFDMYRIETEDDLESIGFYDYTDGIIAAEWCEKIPYALPETYYRVEIEKHGENERKITFKKIGDDRI